MQPCSREMQGMNSLLQDLQNHSQSQVQNPHFDPSQSSNDDFLEQMLSTIPSCSWADLKSPWDVNPVAADLNIGNANAITAKPPRDLSDESVISNPDVKNINNVGFHNFEESALLAYKPRQHQIGLGSEGGGGGPSSPLVAKMLLQQQLMLAASRGGLLQKDFIDATSFKSPTRGGDGWHDGFGAADTLHETNQPSAQQFQHLKGGTIQAAAATQASGSTGGAPAQPRQRVRARRGQATDPHSIAERLRRERIAERMKALQELVPNANKTDKASMLDEIIDYLKFLQLQVKVLSMSRLGGASAVVPLGADMSSEGGGDCIQTNANAWSLARPSNGDQTASTNDSLTMTEHQVAKLMEEDMGSAMQYLQGKGLCLMPISLATAISTATGHARNPVVNNGHPLLQSNGEGPSSPSMSVLTVQSATMGNGGGVGSVKDAASVSKT